jgi:single-strand DNA-binding protein
MITSKNMVMLEGNMVADPESPTDGILNFRMAVNNGGYENQELAAGFFNVKVFYNGLVQSHADFIKRQVDKGNFAKGTRVAVVGQLRQERWKSSEDQNRDKIILIAHSVEFAGFKNEEDGEGGGASDGGKAKSSDAEIPDAF